MNIVTTITPPRNLCFSMTMITVYIFIDMPLKDVAPPVPSILSKHYAPLLKMRDIAIGIVEKVRVTSLDTGIHYCAT